MGTVDHIWQYGILNENQRSIYNELTYILYRVIYDDSVPTMGDQTPYTFSPQKGYLHSPKQKKNILNKFMSDSIQYGNYIYIYVLSV